MDLPRRGQPAAAIDASDLTVRKGAPGHQCDGSASPWSSDAPRRTPAAVTPHDAIGPGTRPQPRTGVQPTCGTQRKRVEQTGERALRVAGVPSRRSCADRAVPEPTRTILPPTER